MREKIENLQEKLQTFKRLNKIIFLVEFLASVGLAVEIFQIFTTKAYQGYWSLAHLIFGMIGGMVVLLTVIYNVLCCDKKIEKLFLAIVIPIGIAYAIFVLPLNVPDEGVHIMKANDMANGNIFTKVTEDGKSSVTIAKFLQNFSYARFKTYQDVYGEILQDTNYQDTIQMVCVAQGNSPLLYIGSSIAIKISQIMGLNMLIAIYMARIFNFVIFLLFGYFTIKKIPFGKLVMLLYLCMPMMLHQAASCSADAVLNATLIYYLAHMVYMMFKETEITKKDKMVLYILTACIAMFKYVYILMAGVLFSILFQKKIEKKEKFKIIGIMILVGSIFTIGWYIFTSQYKTIAPETLKYNEQVNVDGGRQIQFMKENPIGSLKVLIKEYTIYGIQYVMMAVGSELGWLNVKPNIGIIILYMVLLFYAVITEKSNYEFKRSTKLWICFLVLAIAGLTKIAMYIGFTPVGLERVCGVQGRYFTPILILPLLCLVKKGRDIMVKNKEIKLSLFAVFLNIMTLICVFQSYLVGV